MGPRSSPAGPGPGRGESASEIRPEAVAALEEALQRHDYSRVEGHLAPDFEYAGRGGRLAREILRQVVSGFPDGLERIEILRSTAGGEERRMDVRLHGVGDGAAKTLRLDARGRLLEAEVARIQLAAHGGGAPAASRAGSVELAAAEVRVPFELRDAFPVPVVAVDLGDGRPRLFAVDTAAACSALVRGRVARELGLAAEGSARVGDSGGAVRSAAMVTLPSLRVAGLLARDVPAVAHTPSADHAASIPDDLDGILGRYLFEDLLLTLDYPGRELRLASGKRLEPGPGVIPWEAASGVMQLRLDVAGVEVPVLLDTGHRGPLTLPASWAERLPLDGAFVEVGAVATVSTRYENRGARLDGRLRIGSASFEAPPVVFSAGDAPSLLGGGLLRHLVVSVDQRSGLLRFEAPGGEPVRDVPMPRWTALRESTH